jgi:ABC-type nitrate/sulfonate/bicarbonate transport system ATPase subunit
MFAVPDIGTSACLLRHPARVLLHFSPSVAQARRISAAKALISRANRLGTSDALALMRALKAWWMDSARTARQPFCWRAFGPGGSFPLWPAGALRWRRRMPVKLHLDHVGMAFTTPSGTFRAVEPTDLEIETGRFVSLVGPSGCGKSTLFNVIAGLLQPTEGRVLIDGEDATGTIGRVGYMLQKDLLLPWRTVLDNVILGMEIQGKPLKEARERALPLLQKYGLAGFEHLYPNSLSGGMRQRAALLRTLLFDTEVILLDEPFGALDAQTKSQMQEWLMQLWSDFRKTVVFVTHDVEEAIYLSDEIHVMGTRPGRILETIALDMPRPRPRSVALTPEFVAIKERCLNLLTTAAPALEAA